MDLHVYKTATGHEARMGEKVYPCAVGKSGIDHKKGEGDHITPLGTWPLRYALIRPDLQPLFQTKLPIKLIDENTGWCDDTNDDAYNTQVTLPYKEGVSVENFQEAGALYDIVIVVGFNDNPVIKGAGSAIFIHIAREKMTPTAGCVAFKRDDLINIAKNLTPHSKLIIT